MLYCDNNLYQMPLYRYQTNMAASILDTVMSIQPKEGGAGAGETRESVVFKMAADMLDKLPQNYVPHEVGAVIKLCSDKIRKTMRFLIFQIHLNLVSIDSYFINIFKHYNEII